MIFKIVVCDHLLRIRHFSLGNPGSHHDSPIWQDSSLRVKLDDSKPEDDTGFFLLGDSAYPTSRILIAPIREDRLETESQRNFNVAHKSTRIRVENCFGILKKRFPFLLNQICIRKLDNVMTLISSTILLHKLPIEYQEPPPIFDQAHYDEREEYLRGPMDPIPNDEFLVYEFNNIKKLD